MWPVVSCLWIHCQRWARRWWWRASHVRFFGCFLILRVLLIKKPKAQNRTKKPGPTIWCMLSLLFCYHSCSDGANSNTWRQVWKWQCCGQPQAWDWEAGEVASMFCLWAWTTCLHVLILLSEKTWSQSSFQQSQCRIWIQIGPLQCFSDEHVLIRFKKESGGRVR